MNSITFSGPLHDQASAADMGGHATELPVVIIQREQERQREAGINRKS